MEATITHSRPIATISIHIEESGEGCLLTRKEDGFFGSSQSSISTSHSYTECFEGITKWANGDVVQVALPNWTPQLREWLITGMAWEES